MWEQGSARGFIIFSALQRQDEKYFFEYFSFHNVKILLVNKNDSDAKYKKKKILKFQNDLNNQKMTYTI
jgi:hypothetical protein